MITLANSVQFVGIILNLLNEKYLNTGNVNIMLVGL
jgi:hypothetical protein